MPVVLGCLHFSEVNLKIETMRYIKNGYCNFNDASLRDVPFSCVFRKPLFNIT